MAILERLDVDRLRNLRAVKIHPAPHINILYGDNGSGKTSLLEAVYILGHGRSFRSNKLDPIIQQGSEDFVVYADLQGRVSMGLQKSRRGHILKLQGEKQSSWLALAEQLPLQLLNSDSFALLEGSSRIRRKFLDWGVFHVEHSFVLYWRAVAKCLMQRNLLLKQAKPDLEELAAWDFEFCKASQKVHEARALYFQGLLPYLEREAGEIVPLAGISFEYQSGWNSRSELAELLRKNLERDLRYGATQLGPHRADIAVKLKGKNAAEIMSRGQQKLLVTAMKIAQGSFLEEISGAAAIYLVDDLPAELDARNRKKVCERLAALNSQIFFSCVAPEDFGNIWDSDTLAGKFHVEHGKITQL